MRLIDAEKLGVVTVKVPDGVDAESYVKGCQDILERIDVAPTVDAVPVVRCKECRHYERCELMTDDGFCSDGERKDDE